MVLGCASYAQDVSIEFGQEIEVPFASVEKAPLYPGCDAMLEGDALKQCFTESVTNHILQNFNTDMVSELGLPAGKVRIFAVFKISTDGSVTNIQVRGPKEELEKEVLRVLNLLPIMERPGLQKEQPVIVPYSIPIIFEVEKEEETKKPTMPDTYPIYKGCSKKKSNRALATCFSEKVSKFLSKNFDHNIFEMTNLSDTRYRVLAKFTVDTEGHLKDIKVRGPHALVEQEVRRLLKQLPQMTPAMLNGKPLDMQFTLPIWLN